MDSVNLFGSEDVERAGRSIAAAAEGMRVAADRFEFALQHHQNYLTEWLDRLEAVLGNDRDEKEDRDADE